MAAMDQLRPIVGTKQACHALAVPRATWYRHAKIERCRCRQAAENHDHNGTFTFPAQRIRLSNSSTGFKILGAFEVT